MKNVNKNIVLEGLQGAGLTNIILRCTFLVGALLWAGQMALAASLLEYPPPVYDSEIGHPTVEEKSIVELDGKTVNLSESHRYKGDTVSSLIKHLDEGRHALYLQAFFRMGGVNPALREAAVQELAKALANETENSRRWFLMQSLYGMGCLKTSETNRAAGLNAYKLILNRFQKAQAAGAEDIYWSAYNRFCEVAIDLRLATSAVNDIFLIGFNQALELARQDRLPPTLPRWGRLSFEVSSAWRWRNFAEMLIAMEARLADPKTRPNYALLYNAAALYSLYNPERSIKLLRQAKPLLRPEQKELVKDYYTALVAAQSDAGDKEGAIATQKEMIAQAGAGYGALAGLYLETYNREAFDEVVRNLNPATGDDEDLQKITYLLAYSHNLQDKKKAREQILPLLQGYLNAPRKRTVEGELLARLVYGQLLLKTPEQATVQQLWDLKAMPVPESFTKGAVYFNAIKRALMFVDFRRPIARSAAPARTASSASPTFIVVAQTTPPVTPPVTVPLIPDAGQTAGADVVAPPGIGVPPPGLSPPPTPEPKELTPEELARVRFLLEHLDKGTNRQQVLSYIYLPDSQRKQQRQVAVEVAQALAKQKAYSKGWFQLQTLDAFISRRTRQGDYLDDYENILAHYREAEAANALDEYWRALSSLMEIINPQQPLDDRLLPRGEEVLMTAFQASLALARRNHTMIPVPRWPLAGRYFSKKSARSLTEMMVSIEAALNDPGTPKTYALLILAGAVYAEAHPEHALKLFLQAKPLLPQKAPEYVEHYYSSVVALNRALGRTTEAVIAQYELIRAQNQGYATLAEIYLFAGDIANFDQTINRLNATTSSDGDIKAIAKLLMEKPPRGEDEKRRGQAITLLGDYIQAKRTRSLEVELWARTWCADYYWEREQRDKAKIFIDLSQLAAPKTGDEKIYYEMLMHQKQAYEKAMNTDKPANP